MALFPTGANQPNHGIQDKLTIDGQAYTLRSSNPTDTPSVVDWQDQNGALAGSIQFDVASTASLTAIGPALAADEMVAGQSHRFPLAVGSSFTFRGKTWQITDISEAGTYNDLTTWTINIRRNTNWPGDADTALPALAPSDGSAALPCGPAAAPPSGT